MTTTAHAHSTATHAAYRAGTATIEELNAAWRAEYLADVKPVEDAQAAAALAVRNAR